MIQSKCYVLLLGLFSLLAQAPVFLFGQDRCGTQVTEQNLQHFSSLDSSYWAWMREQPEWQSRSPEEILIQPHMILKDDGSAGFDENGFIEALQLARDHFLPMNIDLKWCEFNYIRDTELHFLQAEKDVDSLGLNNVPGRINLYFTPFTTLNGFPIAGFAFLPGAQYEFAVVNTFFISDGATLSHELGHYFGLYHTHGKTNFGTTDELVDGSNCATAGDDICDTPADPNLQMAEVDFNCLYSDTLRDANQDLYDPDPTNLMAYSTPMCQNRFSTGQYARMRFFLETDRNHLRTPSACTSCLEVTNVEKTGPGSLAAAIECANNRPRPDTIKILVEEGTLVLDAPLPTLTDRGNVIRSVKGKLLQIKTERPLSHIFEVKGAETTLEGMEIHLDLLDQGTAISVLAEARDFGLKNLTIIHAGKAIALHGAYGTIAGNRFEACLTGILVESEMEGIHLTENNFVCNAGFLLEGAEKLSHIPAVPEILGFQQSTLYGKATAGSRIELFAPGEGFCPNSICQGEYLGSTEADLEGNWTFPVDSRAIQQMTATSTVENGGKRYTSDFADCWVLVPNTNFWLYPNPLTGRTLSFELKSGKGEYEIRILNLLGQPLFQIQQEMEGGWTRETLDLGEWLSAGVYLFELTKGQEQYRQKIVIQ